ncbi:efflux RND transporter permease subunit [Falsibacillus pallidus]|uniref:HAE1 family hydrophobic/amphiphilic exporter-1 n=1 Tax=Falsibacillus pallidus TaxID=493781 RepID=A0A370GPF9_9BACI|nr:efflux RND transporter permease subunit [Falsibacillus pallidus]RDI45411.1 HAE1 family hydrophobic/amphiphilic exporter-1 [Falsibacillus pallidus]
MIKSVIQFSMKNTVALLLMVFLVVGGGIYSLQQINIEKYPNVDIPYLTVVIPYPGASPEQSTRDIGEPLERELMNIDGVKNVYTDGGANAVYETLEFNLDVKMKDAEQLVRSAIDKVKLPDTAGNPELIKQGPDADPAVYTLGIYSKGDNEKLQSYVKDKVVPKLESIEGFSKVDVGGIEDKNVFIRLIPEKLTKYGLTLEDVKRTIEANNFTVPTGDIKSENEVLPVRVSKELTSLEEIKNIKLFLKPSQPGQLPVIDLNKVAEVSYESQNVTDFTRINGKEGVRFAVSVEGGANVVGIVDEIKKKMKNVELPEGYKLVTLRDQSVEIKESVYTMLREALLGAGMAVLVTLLFLRNIRSTLIAIISIPLSILASFTVLNMLGYTLNIMTLAGIAVAVGRVVDDSIVVIENVFRRVRASKEPSAKLVEQSTREVAAAITSSTITTVAVFLPMAFVPGIVGNFFAPLAWTIVISLVFSLIVAITIVPLLSRIFLLKVKPKEHKETGIQRIYRKSIGWSLRHRLITMAAALILLIATAAIIGPKLGTTFLPQEESRDFDVNITMDKGTDPNLTSDAANKVEEILLDTEGIGLVSTSVNGQYERASITFHVKDSITDVDALVKSLRNSFKSIKEPQEISVTALGGLAGGAESQYVMVVKGSDFEEIKSASTKMVQAIKEIPGMADVHSSLEGDKPEISLEMDDKKLAEHGLMAGMVGKNLRDMLNGDVVTSIEMDNEKTDVTLGLKMGAISSLEKLGEQKILNVMGEPVALKEIGTLKKVKNRDVITHLNGNEYVMVYGQITDAKTGEVTKNADKAIEDLALPKSVTYYKEGASAAMDEGFKNMGIAIGVSVLLVYMTLVIAFGEGKGPFVILFAIPFSLIGALLGLFIVGEPIGMPAMIGLLMLNGIVVTNAIVLVDKVKQNEKRGMPKHAALLDAGVIRLRPILMTAIATIGALIPMAVSAHAGIVSSSLAVVVIGGLTTSTLLTLFIVPVLYSLFHPVKKLKKQKKDLQSQAG